MSAENDDQKAFWEKFSALWVARQADLDAVFAPVLDGVLSRAALKPGETVLDIGCGTGTSTVRAAQAVAHKGHVVGADISEPMLVRARQVAEGQKNCSFETMDVAHHPFQPGTFDKVISRFGVMFFADPDVAFHNIFKAMRKGGTLTMACWSTLDANPWFLVPMFAAKDRLGAPPRIDPDAPGPLAFRNIDRVTGILESAGFDAIEAEAKSLLLTPAGTLEDVAMQATSIGPAARAIEHFEAGQADVDAIASAVTERFGEYLTPQGVRVPAQINFFTARAPAH